MLVNALVVAVQSNAICRHRVFMARYGVANIEPFTGFPAETFEFLRGLKENNSKAWFDDNRKTYDQYVVGPSRSFVVAMGGQLKSRISVELQAEPKTNGSMGRINRDIRFSADKTPYNTHLAFAFWQGTNKKTGSQFVVWLSADDVMVGVGTRGFDKAMLTRYRDAIVADKSGGAFAALMKKLDKLNATRSEPHYKKVPKGYDAAHPRAQWLRYTTCHAGLRESLPKAATSVKFAKWCADRCLKLAPLHAWLNKHVGS